MTRKKSTITCLLLWVGLCSPAFAEKIGALGRIEPKGGVYLLNGPHGDVVDTICVKVGDVVKKDAPLVYFENKILYEQEVAFREALLKEADEVNARLMTVQKTRIREAEEVLPPQIELQGVRQKIAKSEANFAERARDRYCKAGDQSVSILQLDERTRLAQTTKLNVEVNEYEYKRLLAQQQVASSLGREELLRLEKTREVSILRAKAELEMARARLARCILTAPVDGTILSVQQRPGESTGGVPVVSMGDLTQMYVAADIYEGDLLKISPGMKAKITGKVFAEALTGQVEEIGRIISASDKTAKVKIRLDDSAVASRLINMEVDVFIEY